MCPGAPTVGGFTADVLFVFWRDFTDRCWMGLQNRFEWFSNHFGFDVLLLVLGGNILSCSSSV